MDSNSGKYESEIKDFAEVGHLSRFSGHHDFANGQTSLPGRFVTRQDSCADDVSLGPPVSFQCDARPCCHAPQLPGFVDCKSGCQQYTLINISSDRETVTMKPQQEVAVVRPKQRDPHGCVRENPKLDCVWENPKNDSVWENPKLYQVHDPSIMFPSQNLREKNPHDVNVNDDSKISLKDTLKTDDVVHQPMTSYTPPHTMIKSSDLKREENTSVNDESQTQDRWSSKKTPGTAWVNRNGQQTSSRLSGLGLDVTLSENHRKTKGWSINLVWILIIFSMSACLFRLQARVDRLENTVMAMVKKIEEDIGQAQIQSLSFSSSEPISTNIEENKSTSYGNGYTGSLVVDREDPINDISEHDKANSDLPVSTNRENQKRNNARQNFPAKAARGWDIPEDELMSASTSHEKQPFIENVNRHQKIFDSNIYETNEAENVDYINLKSNEQSPNLLKNRFKRNTLSEKEKEMEKYCKSTVCNDKKDKPLSAVLLPAEKFVGDFYHVYDYKQDFLNKSRDCFVDTSLPTEPFVCKEATFQYTHPDSVLAFYRPPPGEKCKGKKKCSGPLLELSSPLMESFLVRVPGIYALHINITMVDESHNHSLALYLNDQAVMACPKGGFRCPKTNEKDSVKYRICNINGLLELNENDALQLRTLERNTTVRLENHRQSHFKAVLLHRTGEVSHKKVNKQRGKQNKN